MEEIANTKLWINECWLDDYWDVGRLTELVGVEATLKIIHNSHAGKTRPDLFVWKPSKDGSFSIASAWEMVRKKGEQMQWKEWIWHCLLPKRVGAG